MSAGTSLVPLSQLLVSDRPSTTSVAEHAGAIIDLATFRLDVARNAQILQQCGCRRGLLVTEDAYLGAVGLFALMLAGAEVIVPPNGNPGTLALLASAWDFVVCDTPLPGADRAVRLERGAATDADLSRLAALPGDAPLVFFTSGSTGTPKRVAKRLVHLEHEAAAIEAVLGQFVPASARIEATVPHQHVYGLGFRVGWPLATGRSFRGRMHEHWDSVLPQLDRNCALITSPAHLSRLDGIAAQAPERRPCLVLSAGAPLTEAAARTAAEVLGVGVTEIFGSTETGAIAWRQRTGRQRTGRHGTGRQQATREPSWHALPGVAIGKTADGLFTVEAAHVPDAPCVGADRVDIDADGGLRFNGRADAIVKIEGARVSLVEVEQQLRALAEVQDAAVVGLGDPIEQLAAVVVPSLLGARALADSDAFRFGRRLRRALADTQQAAGQPRRWRFVEQIPSGPLGKRRACDLAALFAAGVATDAADTRSPKLPRPEEPELRDLRVIADGAELDLFIPPDLVWLDGHFPGQPIVPGVVLIDWVVQFAARHLAVPVEAAQTFAVKFRQVMQPGQTVTLTLRHPAGRPRMDFEYRVLQQVMASGSIVVGQQFDIKYDAKKDAKNDPRFETVAGASLR